jgi:NAD(P)-dependent dehydrogenase (short-subunit alcohol dehydrogenase family)
MEISGRTIVVTGAARGIGAALARRFADDGAGALVLADLDGAAVAGVAAELGPSARGVELDVTDAARVEQFVRETLDQHGGIDLYCSNAGIATGEGLDAADEVWQRTWAVNVLAHVYAARAVLPSMLARGSGYLLQTCSAAGLLTAIGDAPYSLTKHAAVALAEWIAITYGDRGIRVSALCPQGVDTDMLRTGVLDGHVGARAVAAAGRVIEPAEVADAVVAGLAQERFLILPHPEVEAFYRNRASDPDRWLAGMRRFVGGLTVE